MKTILLGIILMSSNAFARSSGDCGHPTTCSSEGSKCCLMNQVGSCEKRLGNITESTGPNGTSTYVCVVSLKPAGTR